MEKKPRSFEELDASAERIGVIGSPSSTAGVLVDVMGHSVDKRLVGALTYFAFDQAGKRNCAIGQITEIQLRNLWVEGATLRSLIRQKGSVEPLTGRQDTHTAEMTVGAVFAEETDHFEQSQLGTVPPTGTPVKQVGDVLIDHLLEPHAAIINRIGRFYGNETYFPAWFRHFGDPGKNKLGAGEAYHIGIFGKTGSGKSVLSRIMLMGYAVHPEMTIMVIDPQGEFYQAFAEGTEAREFLEKTLHKQVVTINVRQLRLLTPQPTYPLFVELLSKTEFFGELPIYDEANKSRAKTEIAASINRKGALDDTRTGQVPCWELGHRDVFTRVWRALHDPKVLTRIYTDQKLQQRIMDKLDEVGEEAMFSVWEKVAGLFTYQTKPGEKHYRVDEIVQQVDSGADGKFLVIDLSEESRSEKVLWNERVQMTVLSHFIAELRKRGEAAYREKRKLNALILLDEAHRFAPRDIQENDKDLGDKLALRHLLIDSVRTTRKHGLGWGFISQTLASVDKELVNQIRIYVFGYGLAWGSEFRALTDLMGGTDALRLYQTFRDPETSLGERQFPFMVTGPLSPLSFSGSPLFFTALRWPDEALAAVAARVARARAAA
jgi:hypothetical protein